MNTTLRDSGLVLSRLMGEAIMIGDDIVIDFLAVKGEAVRVRVRAPREIPVHREEVYWKIKEDEERKKNAHTTTN